MWQKVKKYWLPVAASALTLVVALFWVALRVNYAGISKFLGADKNPTFLVMNLPLMFLALVWLVFGLAVWGLFAWKKRRWPAIAAFAAGAVLLIVEAVIVYMGAWDYLRFILVHFWKSLGVTACILAFALLLFFPPVSKTRKAFWLKVAAVVLVTAVCLVAGYALRGNSFSCGAVVYAVEDDYQIVFSTTDNSICWVQVGDEVYYDLYAGSMKSADKVHKVEVPQDVLDAAGGYTVCAQQMIYRGPFGGYKGEVISEEYSFRGVDSSDGLNYVALSDVHEAVDAATRAATAAVCEDVDFVVLLGDLVSMVETEADAQLANELAHGITGGEIPVIYVRGNHEIKGEWAEELYKYVGSKHESFCYTVTLGDDDVFAVVLDMGEDHEDDWWEYYGTAQFDLYRAEQTELLEDVLEDGDYENYRYRMALCHIPVPYVDKNGYFETFRNEWTSLLNEMDPDIYLGGHKHVLWPFIPGQIEPNTTLVYSEAYSGREGKAEGGYLTDFNFPGFLVGRRSLELTGDTQTYGKTDYLCLYTRADFEAGQQTSFYVNSNGEVPTGAYPFVEETFTEVVTDLKRPE